VHKLRFFFILLLLPSLLFAQQKSRVELIGSTRMQVDNKTNISYVKNPTFKHDNAILKCDSAVFYIDLNYFEAFKNVHINQADTMNIYSDLLNYDGNSKMAHLINNVRMIDPTAVLTTNILDYDMGLRIGKYLEGGKIVSTAKDVTITSKRGWYFANNNDAWFKQNVDIITKQAKIKSDSVKYNTVSNWAYFYGKTNIKGKDDNLYTENGKYNTKSEEAFFGKNNLYTQNSKSLTGDSLFYDGKKGYGKAVKNVVFIDTADKLSLYGQKGEYYKEGEKVIVTDHAYLGLATADSVMVKEIKTPDSLWIAADTLQAQMILQKTIKLISTPIVLADNEIGAESAAEKKQKEEAKAAANAPANTPAKPATTLPAEKDIDKKAKVNKTDSLKTLTQEKIKLDSLVRPPDSIPLKLMTKAVDSAKKIPIKVDSVATKVTQEVKKASKETVKATAKAATAVVEKATAKLPVKPLLLKDSVVVDPADTVKTRTIKAHRNVRVFKANFQAKSDSLFYSAADSTLRWYQDPMIWSEASQQTGDTIYVQFKNKKIHNLQVLKNGFMVNTEGDSTKFNQVKGKLMTGFFNDGELKHMFVDGNAESIYFTKEKEKEKEIYKMNQTTSARIKFSFLDKELDNIKTIKDTEGAYFSDTEIPKEPTLTGFIWKPELRPKSKEDVVRGKETEKPKATAKPAAKAPVKAAPTKKPATTTKNTASNPKTAVKKVDTPEKVIPKPIKTDSIKIDTTQIKK
jgi:lipopolysaccharide export system protein LptA